MKLNRKWLNEEFVDLSHVSDKEFVETLTVFGQKVETYERMDAEIKNVMVGKVLSHGASPQFRPYVDLSGGRGTAGACADRYRCSERP